MPRGQVLGRYCTLSHGIVGSTGALSRVEELRLKTGSYLTAFLRLGLSMTLCSDFTVEHYT